jgi:hypothetical protein
MAGLLVGINGGCLSLSMLNRDTPDTKQRLDSLEQRVSALENSGGCRCAQPALPTSRPQGYGFPGSAGP